MWLLLQQFCGDTPASIYVTAQGFDTSFTLMPENTFGVANTFKKMQQNFAEMPGPEESWGNLYYRNLYFLNKQSFLGTWWLQFPQWSVYTWVLYCVFFYLEIRL